MSGNVPAIRFAGFTEPWEQRKLGDIAEIIGGGTPDTSNPDYWDGDIDWYSPAELGGQVYADGSIRKITKAGYSNSSAKMLPANKTILFTSRAGIGTTAILRRSACTNQGFQSIVVEDGTSVYFLYSLSGRIKKYAEVKAAGSTFLEISGKQLANMDLLLPSLAEQREIGALFQRLDNLITLHLRKHDQLVTLKKSLLEKMFPKPGSDVPELRFAEFTEPWEQRKLGELCEVKDSARVPNSLWGESGIPYIRASDLSNNNMNGVLFLSPDTFDFYSTLTGNPVKGDVLFNGGGEIGKAYLLTEKSQVYVQGGAVLYARTSESQSLDGQFLEVAFESNEVRSYIEVAAAGGTMKHFTLSPARTLPLCVPCMPEQQAIGTLFSRLDSLITLHLRKHDQLVTLKKSLLEKMFV